MEAEVKTEPVTVPDGEDRLLPHERAAVMLSEIETKARAITVTVSLYDLMLFMYGDDSAVEGLPTRSNTHDGPQQLMRVRLAYGHLFKMLDPNETHLKVFLYETHAEVWRIRNWRDSMSCKMQTKHGANVSRVQRNIRDEQLDGIVNSLRRKGLPKEIVANLAPHLLDNPELLKQLGL